MAEKLYAQQGGAAGAAGPDTDAGTAGSQQASADDDVVDAEFEEVQDDKKS
jgi:molecular chaperone DnaK